MVLIIRGFVHSLVIRVSAFVIPAHGRVAGRGGIAISNQKSAINGVRGRTQGGHFRVRPDIRPLIAAQKPQNRVSGGQGADILASGVGENGYNRKRA
jgi:hypothetical protein